MTERQGHCQAAAGRRRPTAEALRVMYYSHDTYGLGHLRRTLAIARHVQRQLPRVTQLIVTGSPVAGDLLLPDDADYVKLPSVVKVGPEAYAARAMIAPFADVRDMRAGLILSTARHFRPDILLADHAPAGVKGELVPALRYLKRHRPEARLVAGLRDVVDEPERVQRAWADQGVYGLLDGVYDRILVYGQPDVFDVVRRYRLSAAAADKTRYIGYLRREPDPGSGDIAIAGDPGWPLVLFTAGGGGDGVELLLSAADALRHAGAARRWRALLVAGPLMDPAARAELAARLADLPAVTLLSAAPGLAGLVARADAVVAMGGYNTVCEVLSFERPALIVPRIAPRREQLIRAEALARRGLVRMLHPDDVAPDRLLGEVAQLLARPTGPRVPVALDGLPKLVDELVDLVAMSAGPTAGLPAAALSTGVYHGA